MITLLAPSREQCLDRARLIQIQTAPMLHVTGVVAPGTRPVQSLICNQCVSVLTVVRCKRSASALLSMPAASCGDVMGGFSSDRETERASILLVAKGRSREREDGLRNLQEKRLNKSSGERDVWLAEALEG